MGAIQVDLEYMQRGFMYDEVRGGDTSYHRTINTFELPFMWQPHIYVFQRHARVYLNLGVYLSMPRAPNITGNRRKTVFSSRATIR